MLCHLTGHLSCHPTQWNFEQNFALLCALNFGENLKGLS